MYMDKLIIDKVYKELYGENKDYEKVHKIRWIEFKCKCNVLGITPTERGFINHVRHYY